MAKKTKAKEAPTPESTIAISIGSTNIRAAQFDTKHNVPKILVFSNGERFLEIMDPIAMNSGSDTNQSLTREDMISRRINLVLEESAQYFQQASDGIEINKILQMDWFLGAWYAYMDSRYGIESTRTEKQNYNFMAIKWGSSGVEIKCSRVLGGKLVLPNAKTTNGARGLDALRPETRHLKIDRVLYEKHPSIPVEYEVSRQDTSPTDSAAIGGAAIDERLMQFLATEFGKKNYVSIKNNQRAQDRLRLASENAKKTLSNTPSALLQLDALAEDIDFSTKVSQPRFEMLISQSLNAIMDLLGELYPRIEGGVDYVAFVGGSTNIPIFRKRIQSFFDYHQKERSAPIILNQIPPEEVGVLGHCIHSLYSRSTFTTQDLLHAPSRIGVIDPHSGSFITAIESGSRFPVSATISVEKEGSEKQLVIAEDESMHLAYFPIPEGTSYPFEVKFSVDNKGCLTVETLGESLRFA